MCSVFFLLLFQPFSTYPGDFDREIHSLLGHTGLLMPEYAKPLWIDLKNIFLRKRRMETLEEFCDKLQEFNLQPTSDIVHGELGLLIPEKALEARDALSCILRKERNPDLCKFLKGVLENELEVLNRMSMDMSDELKSLLRKDYEPWMSVIQKFTRLDHDKFQKQVNSWFTTIQNGIIFEGDVGSSAVIENIRRSLIKVEEQIANVNVRLKFYRELDKHNLQPSTKDLVVEFHEWPGDKSIVSRWQMFKIRTPNPNINHFFITELENLMTDLQFKSHELRQDFKSCFADGSQYFDEMQSIQKLTEEKVKSLHQAKEELLNQKRSRSDETSAMSSGNHNLRRSLRNVMYRQARTNINLDFYTKLESLSLQPSPNVYVRELADWLGDKEDIYRKRSAFKETSNMDFTSFFKRELQELAAKLEAQSNELQRQLESNFLDKLEYHKELTKISLSAQEPVVTVQKVKDKLLELIMAANKAELKRKNHAKKGIMGKELTKIMIKKSRVDVHLNFYRRLQNEGLEPTLEICERDLTDWLGDRDGINKKWETAMQDQSPCRTSFFINELEKLKADLEQKSEKLETDFAKLYNDGVGYQSHLEFIHDFVENSTNIHKLKYAKGQLLNKLLADKNKSAEFLQLPTSEEVSAV